MENTLSFSLTEQTISIARFCPNAHLWPSRFQSLLPIFLFDWLKWSRIYSRKLKKNFFSRRQDTPEYSQVFILQKLGFRLYIIFTYFFFTPLPLTIICDQPSSQRSDQSSSWFEVDRRGRAGFEFSSWLAWIFSDNVWQVHKFKSAMTILFTDIVSTTHRVKQETACNFTARTTRDSSVFLALNRMC